MISVVLAYPNGQRQEVLLAGIPHVGDHVRLKDGLNAPSLVVEHVLWLEVEAGVDETVVIVVRPHGVAPPG